MAQSEMQTDPLANQPDSTDPGQRKVWAATLSVGSNALLVALKLGIGLWSGSVAVLSEAVHSGTDLLAAGIALVSVRMSASPPDEEHPYGHGKFESLSGLAEALLIFVAAAYILYEALRQLNAPHTHPPEALTIGAGVMAFSAVVNLFISRYLHRVATETDSLALAADAEHLRVDVITSVGVFIGLLLVRVTHLYWLDPLVAIAVALLVIRTAWQLSQNALHQTLDARLPQHEEDLIQQILEQDARVLGYHKLRTRKSGSERHADVHVLVDDETPLVDAHDCAEDLEDRIREVLPSLHINIHIEPYHAELRHQEEKHGLSATVSTAHTPVGRTPRNK